MLLGVLTFPGDTAVVLYPLVHRRRVDHRLDHRHLRGQVGRGQRRARALPGRGPRGHHLRAAVHPGHVLDDGRPRRRATRPTWTDIYFCALIGLAVTGALFVITDYYTSTRFAPVKSTARASETGHATNIIQGLAQGLQATAAPGDRDRARDLGRVRAGRHLRHRRGRHGAALALRPDRRARRLRPDHRQRGRHRRDGEHARRGPRRHRPAGRGRQHDQGRHQGLRDRLRRARRARALRRLQDRARRRRAAWSSSSCSTIRRS